MHNNLEGPLFANWLENRFYIFFYNNLTNCYHIKSIRHKSGTFKKFVKFVTWVQNQSENKLERYHTDFRGEFDNKFF